MVIIVTMVIMVMMVVIVVMIIMGTKVIMVISIFTCQSHISKSSAGTSSSARVISVKSANIA